MAKHRPIQKTTPAAKGSPGFAVAGADEFALLAQEYLQQLPRPTLERAQAALLNPGGLLVSATNLSLAIELLLKALLVHDGINAPHTHKLHDLYVLLPQGRANSIATRFETITPHFSEKHECIEILPLANQLAALTNPTDHSLNALLLRNADAYVLWRYTFSNVRGGPSVRLRYEFADLFRAAAAIRAEFGPVTIGPVSNAT